MKKAYNKPTFAIIGSDYQTTTTAQCNEKVAKFAFEHCVMTIPNLGTVFGGQYDVADCEWDVFDFGPSYWSENENLFNS